MRAAAKIRWRGDQLFLAWGLIVFLWLLGNAEDQLSAQTETATPPAQLPSAVPAPAPTPAAGEGSAGDVVDQSAPDLSDAFARSAEKIRPSVVSVNTMSEVQFLDPYEYFFGPRFGGRRGQPREVPRGIGSGIIISDEYILTNNHVIEGADRINVKLADGRSLVAKVVGADPSFDIAVIRIEGVKGLTPAELGDSDALRVGEWVLAVGNPFGLEQTVTSGIISATGRTAMDLSDYTDFIQTDAAINPGNSGGPLVNLKGRVVGINSAILSQSGAFEGIGFAIPMNTGRKIMESLIATGKVVRGYIGIQIQEMTGEVAELLDMQASDGLLVMHVEKRSPAEAAGIKARDIITKVNGAEVDSARRFATMVKTATIGEELELTILRKGEAQTVRVRVGTAPARLAAAETLGFHVANLDDMAAKHYDFGDSAKGVVITQLEKDSPAAQRGLKEGDAIVGVNQFKIENLQDYNGALEKLRSKKSSKILLQVMRRGEYSYVVLPLK
jgi:serine protease Do